MAASSQVRRLTAWSLRSALIAASLVTAAHADDWPQWRGGAVDGIADVKLPAKPRLDVAWTRDVGIGYSTVAVVGDRAYTAGWLDGQDNIWCLNAADGKVIWQHRYPIARYNKMHEGGPAATPAVHDGRVFSLARDGRLFALDAADGKPVWTKDLAKELGVREPDWAFSGSPVVAEGKLLIDVGRVLALDPKTGKVLWKTDDFGAAYSTPVPFTRQGRKLLATFPRKGLTILDFSTGVVIAQYGWRTDYGVNAATPIIVPGSAGKPDRIFVTSGYNTGCAMLEFDGKDLRVAWENREIRGQMATPVLIGDHLYGFDENQLKCVAVATGEAVWSRDVEKAVRSFGKGALAAAGDMLVVQTDSGKVVLAKASPQGFDPVAQVQAFNGRNVWVMPTVAAGRILARSPQGTLAAITVK